MAAIIVRGSNTELIPLLAKKKPAASDDFCLLEFQTVIPNMDAKYTTIIIKIINPVSILFIFPFMFYKFSSYPKYKYQV